MKINFRIIGLVLALLIAGVAIIGYFMWNKPKRNVENETGISITSAQLVKDYQSNEATANAKYLDKAIEVSGRVTEIGTNQEGKATLLLASEDEFTSVFCTLKDNATTATTGATATVKGICSGMLSDVRLREAVILKK